MLPFELHPEIPSEGRPLGRRAGEYYGRVAAECDAAGLPFVAPTRLPNTRRVLESAEWVRIHQPEVFGALHDRLFRAHFVDGDDIGDAATVDALLAVCGADASTARDAVDRGVMRPVVDTSIAKAFEAGVTGTPAWLVGDFVVPGVQPRPFYERLARGFPS